MKKILVIIPLILFALSACTGAQSPATQASPAVNAEIQQVDEVLATATPTAADTATPTPEATAAPAINRANLAVISADNLSQLTAAQTIGDGELTEVQTSPDGKTIAYATSIGIRLLDAATLKQTGFISSSSTVNSIAFSADGSLLAAGLDNGHIQIYATADLMASNGTATKARLDFKAHANPILQVFFGADNTTVLSSSADRTVVLWNAETGKRIHAFAGLQQDISDVTFSPDYRYIAVSSYDGLIRVWNVSSGYLVKQYGTVDPTRTFRQEYPNQVVFDRNTNDIISGLGNGEIWAWKWQFGSEDPLRISLGNDSTITNLVSLGKNQFLSIDHNGQAIQWNSAATTTSGFEKTGTYELGSSIQSAAGLTGGEWVIGKSPATIEEYQPADSKVTASFSLPTQGSQTTTPIFTSDEHLFLTSGTTGAVMLWDVDNTSSPVEVNLAGSDSITAMFKSADNKLVGVAAGKSVTLFKMEDLVGVYNGSVKAADLQAYAQVQTGEPVYDATLSADGSILATAGENSTFVNLWKTADGQKITEMTALKHTVAALAFSPTGSTLAVGSDAHQVYLWKDVSASTTDSAPVIVNSSVSSTVLDWSAKGDFIAVTGTQNQGWVVSVDKAKNLFNLAGAKGVLKATSVSPDGSLIATAGSEGIIRIYDAVKGKLTAELPGQSGSIIGMTFSPKGDRLITSSANGTLTIWQIK
jgi:WD40 repeat protein